MGDFTGLVLLLLPLAAATGWFVARQSRPREELEASSLNPDYVRGLSHLVNNDTDQAIEIFIGLIEADEGTIDLHLALGSLFRRRGEVDRALRIHQNLVQRPRLKPLHRNQARFELARDYQAAGVLDRAEEIFLELAHQGMFLSDCLSRLMRIYEREREWERAIDTAQWLSSAQGRDMGPRIAQYWCELADSALRRDDTRGQQQCLKRALAADPHCVRAQLTRAGQAVDSGKVAQALKIYRDVIQHHEAFIPDVLAPWRDAFLREHSAEQWAAELERVYRRHPHPHLQVALIQAQAQSGQTDARQQALDELVQQPSWVGLHAALDQDWSNLPSQAAGLLKGFADVLRVPLEKSPTYRCDHCGYSGRQLNWQCPSCQHWNTTQPLPDMTYSALEEQVHGASSLPESGAAATGKSAS